MIQKVVHLETVGNITISRNKRSRKLRMTIKPDKQVYVSIPYYSSFRDAISFAKKNTGWIIEQQKKIETKTSFYTPGSKIATKFHIILIEECFDEPKIQKNGNEIKIAVPGEMITQLQPKIREILVSIYRVEAKSFLPPRLAALARQFGFHYNNVTIRNNRRNWGSCSSRNNISLNLHIMKLPDELIDYILLHELAHTIQKNHGPRFWELLDKVTGNNAKNLARKVKHYSPFTS